MAVQYDDELFPEDISYGSSGGPGFMTDIHRTPGGQVQRSSRWGQPLNRYDVSYGIQSHGDLARVRNFFLARMGSARAFRYKDWQDSCSTELGIDPEFDGGSPDESYGQPTWGDQPLVSVDGSTTQFQLVKRYSNDVQRSIIAPVVSTIVVGDDGSQVTSGFTVNEQGVVTFDSAPTDPTWGGFFHYVVMFDQSTDEFLELTVDNFGGGEANGIILREVRSEVLVPTGTTPMGASERAVGSDYTLAVTGGVLQQVEATTSGLEVSLPDPDGLPTGRLFVVVCASTGSGFDLLDHDGTTLRSLTAGQAVEVFNQVDGSGNNLWIAIG